MGVYTQSLILEESMCGTTENPCRSTWAPIPGLRSLKLYEVLNKLEWLHGDTRTGRVGLEAEVAPE